MDTSLRPGSSKGVQTGRLGIPAVPGQTRSARRAQARSLTALETIGIHLNIALGPSNEVGPPNLSKLCYAVFSYGSPSTLDRLAAVLNDELARVDRPLWPNMFYVLGKGLLIPGDDRGVPLDRSTMFTGPRYRTVHDVSAPGLPVSEAYAFLWFLSNIIDHCMEQRRNRESPNLQRYWFSALQIQTRLHTEWRDSEG